MEQWRAIPGYEGWYEVSDHGQVRSVPRINNYGRRYHSRILTPRPNGGGHIRVVLCVNGVNTELFVHKLVLLAFRGPPPPGKTNGLHKNDTPDDNVLSNLYWGTLSQNGYDRVRNGNHVAANKTHCPFEHRLVSPNLVPSSAASGHRSCLACHRTRGGRRNDANYLHTHGEMPTRRVRRGAFPLRAGESFRDESDRRYALIMAAA